MKLGGSNRSLRIIQISTTDIGGGAEKIALSLHRLYRAGGHNSVLLVGKKFSDDPDVIAVDVAKRKWRHRGFDFGQQLMGWQGLSHLESADPLLDLARDADIIHAHNLHGGYFNLGALAKLNKRARLILTLHDPWLLTGHCAHPFDCDRWQTGCGNCPDLAIYPSVRRDGTRFNWRYKRYALSKTNPTIVVPSLWMMDRLEKSYIRPASKHLIYNGVDATFFKPGDQSAARQRLGLKTDRKIVLFTANQGLDNPWKDTKVLTEAFSLLVQRASNPEETPLLLVVGQKHPPNLGELSQHIIVRPFSADAKQVVDYYRAADILAYTSIADNCPLVVLEAMSCGLPTAASAIGGIPELIDSGKTGLLVKPGSAADFSQAMDGLLQDNRLREQIGETARRRTQAHFDLNKMAQAYLDCYREMIR